MIFVLTTCKNPRDAKRIATLLLRARLVACAKWWKISSAYWWKGKLTNTHETLLLLEARKKHYRKVEQFLRRVHTDETPCIVSWERWKVEKKYHAWVHEVTKI